MSNKTTSHEIGADNFGHICTAGWTYAGHFYINVPHCGSTIISSAAAIEAAKLIAHRFPKELGVFAPIPTVETKPEYVDLENLVFNPDETAF